MSESLRKERDQLERDIDSLETQYNAIEKQLKLKLARWNIVNSQIGKKYKSENNSDYGGKSSDYGGK